MAGSLAPLIDVRKLDELRAFLVGMEDRWTDFTIPLTDVKNLILTDVTQAFPTGGHSVGQSWTGHKQTTVERWKSHAFGQGPTGNLIGSIRGFVRKFVSGVEATAPHAHLFEQGRKGVKTIGRGGNTTTIPTTGKVQEPRPFLVIRQETEEAGVRILLDYAVKE